MSDLQQEKEILFKKLRAAFKLELTTIPPYMTALFSIKPEKNRIAAKTIRSVMLEEMLHAILAGNVLNSIGGELIVNQEAVPRYPCRLEFEDQKTVRDREFDINLEVFSQKAIETFLDIERPAQTLDTSENIHLKNNANMEIPALTIGEFYEEIKDKLESLCKEFSEAEVFSGNPAHQIDENYYWGGGGDIVPVVDLASAKKAIDVIVTQGEGTTEETILNKNDEYFAQRPEIAHYYLFNEIYHGKYYKSDSNIYDAPQGEAFEVDYKAVYPIKTNPTTADYEGEKNKKLRNLNHEFNRIYSLMLYQIAQSVTGQPEILYRAIINGMHRLMPIAHQMVTQKIDGSDKHGAPSFEWVDPFK